MTRVYAFNKENSEKIDYSEKNVLKPSDNSLRTRILITAIWI